MDHNKLFEFTAAVRGYHYYQRFWKPQPNQKLSCAYEENNLFDLFVMKICEDTNIVGHLPIEISRASKYLMDRGIIYSATDLSKLSTISSHPRWIRNFC